ncbi:transglutaminase domain-containing protein [Solibacillus sp. CAU 1738]|uniref:transglutaminase domain-containing protein n=1 Tax=Solibacillus sp. CAU 1738 TaxID=3140363 RepID=UPI0032604BF8
MKKLLVLITTVIIILSSLLITPAEISASDFKQKEEKGVNSCKPYTYKSKFKWGNLNLTHETGGFDDESLKITILKDTPVYVLTYKKSMKNGMEYHEAVKGNQVSIAKKGNEYLLSHGYGLTSRYSNVVVLNDGLYYKDSPSYFYKDPKGSQNYHLIKVDPKKIKEEHFTQQLVTKLDCARKDYEARQDKLYAQGSKIIKQIINPKMTEFEQVKAIADYVASISEFDTTTGYKNIPHTSFSKEGVLQKGVAVSQGFADATAFLLDIAGIRNKEVRGEAYGWSHYYWNAVKVDGKWYHLDVTYLNKVLEFNDYIINANYESLLLENPYKFFLVSDQYISNDYKKHWFPYITDTKYDDYFNEQYGVDLSTNEESLDDSSNLDFHEKQDSKFNYDIQNINIAQDSNNPDSVEATFDFLNYTNNDYYVSFEVSVIDENGEILETRYAENILQKSINNLSNDDSTEAYWYFDVSPLYVENYKLQIVVWKSVMVE